jgi:hypothetical protein
VPVLILAFVVAEAIGRRRDGVRLGSIALAVTFGVAAPMLIRNQLLFGSPVYPALAPDLDPWLMKLNSQVFGRGLAVFIPDMLRNLGLTVLVLGVVAAGTAIATRRHDVWTGLLAAALGGIVATPLTPIHEGRHLLPLFAILGLSASVIVRDGLRLPGRRWLMAGFELALALYAGLVLIKLGDRRTPLDLTPALIDADAAIRERVPEGDMILSLWTYDTAYHSGRPATWPIPWSQKDHSPAPLFRETDPARFLAELDRLDIHWILLRKDAGAPAFNGVNYPKSFVDCVLALANAGRIRVVWGSSVYILLHRV